MSQPTKNLGDPLTTSHHAEKKPSVSKSPITGILKSPRSRPLAVRHRDLSKNRRSRHRQSSIPIYAPRLKRSRPLKHGQIRGQALAMFPLPLFHSPSARHSPRLRYRQLSQGTIKHHKAHRTRDVSPFSSDFETRLVLPNIQADTYSASVPSNMDLDITLSYADSPKETQTMDDARATSSEEPMTGYALANEEDYFAHDVCESLSAMSLETPAEYVLANEKDHLAKHHSECEDDL